MRKITAADLIIGAHQSTGATTPIIMSQWNSYRYRHKLVKIGRVLLFCAVRYGTYVFDWNSCKLIWPKKYDSQRDNLCIQYGEKNIICDEFRVKISTYCVFQKLNLIYDYYGRSTKHHIPLPKLKSYSLIKVEINILFFEGYM